MSLKLPDCWCRQLPCLAKVFHRENSKSSVLRRNLLTVQEVPKENFYVVQGNTLLFLFWNIHFLIIIRNNFIAAPGYKLKNKQTLGKIFRQVKNSIYRLAKRTWFYQLKKILCSIRLADHLQFWAKYLWTFSRFNVIIIITRKWIYESP